MYTYTQSTNRYVWDIYAEIAASGFSSSGRILSPREVAEMSAEFADEMCRQRAARFPPEDKKAK